MTNITTWLSLSRKNDDPYGKRGRHQREDFLQNDMYLPWLPVTLIKLQENQL
jgi:hypothetical protein